VKSANGTCVYTIRDHGDATTNTGNGNDQNQLACCVNGNCTFHSFEDALGNVTNNVVIDIKTSVVLSSSFTLENFNNILIKSHTNATVLCTNGGNLHFVSCNNVTIEGIIWQGCGGPHFYNSSNVTIQDCYFHNSTRQAVVMSEVSGDVHIKDCQFAHNNNYGGHGSALYYLFGTVAYPPPVLSINNCSFTSNGPSDSVVYITSPTSSGHDNLLLQDSVFTNNQGVPIYLSNVHVNVLGTVLIRQNAANSGGGIFSTNSIIEFNNCSVHFYNNSATASGGAVYLENSDMVFRLNSSVYGNCVVNFNSNSARYGGAIRSYSASDIFISRDSIVSFRNNKVRSHGGAIYLDSGSDLIVNGTSSVTFDNNTGYYGGAIYINYNSDTLFGGNAVLNFSNNSAIHGGVFYTSSSGVDILCDDYATVTFIDNRASSYGGVMYISQYGTILFGNNTVATFARNTASRGGAVYARYYIQMSFNESAKVSFVNNTASSQGGAMHVRYSNVMFNVPVIFQDNSAQFGLAVYCDWGSSLRFEENLYKEIINYNGEDEEGLHVGSNCDVSVEKYTCKYAYIFYVYCVTINTNAALCSSFTCKF